MPVVLQLDRRIQSNAGVKGRRTAVFPCGRYPYRAARLEPRDDPADRERLAAGQPQRRGTLALRELERQHAHADQVAAVNALVALGDRRLHALERRTLGCPVARAPGAVFLAGQYDEWNTFLPIPCGGVIDAGHVA